jgi:hypothetical protein
MAAEGRFTERAGVLVPAELSEVSSGWTASQALTQIGFMAEQLQERIAELEFAREDQDFRSLDGLGVDEFTVAWIQGKARQAMLYYLSNPLIRRGVDVQAFYVFGQGVEIHARSQAVDEEIVQPFLADASNREVLTSLAAMLACERTLQLSGNLFLPLFTSPKGRVQVREIRLAEIVEIVTNPEDAREPWYYKRVWSQAAFDSQTGRSETKTLTRYYPDVRYRPQNRPAAIGGVPVDWTAPVLHVRTGGLSHMRYGVSELYPALAWARAYREFLENWATIVKAYSRFAWQMTVQGRQLGAAQAKLASTLARGGAETNPPPAAGSIFATTPQGAKMEPIRTAGATTSAEDGRRMLLMVAAAVGLPETFFGDVSVGTLATANSLDRPTELKFRSRQTMWADVLEVLLTYVTEAGLKARKAQGTVTAEDDGTPAILVPDDDGGGLVPLRFDIDYPPILEHDVAQAVGAIVDAATLKGGTPAGLVDDRTLSRMLLSALGVDDIDTLLDTLYPDDSPWAKNPRADPVAEQERAQELAAQLGGSDTGEPGSDAPTGTQGPPRPPKGGRRGTEVDEALRELREALAGFVTRYGRGDDPAASN